MNVLLIVLAGHSLLTVIGAVFCGCYLKKYWKYFPPKHKSVLISFYIAAIACAAVSVGITASVISHSPRS